MCSPTRPSANKPTNYQQRTDPRSCVRVVYIAGDTLRQQPIGAGHMTVLQLRGPMGSRVLPWWLFIAGDTLRHQPMRTGHMTVLQLRGLMEFRVLQWCHPMLASLMEDKLLYPDDHLIWCSKVDSGPRISICFPFSPSPLSMISLYSGPVENCSPYKYIEIFTSQKCLF